jgi:hypothetical protein
MITQEELNEKVIKLMAMAGTEGGSYSLWSVNQIVHGLKEAVTGATADRVKLSLDKLIFDGTVKERLPSREKDPTQYVLVNKAPAPEPLNSSPVVVRRGTDGDEDDSRLSYLKGVVSFDSITRRLQNVEEVMSDLNKVVSSVQDKNKEMSREIGETQGSIEDWKGEVRSLKRRIRYVEEDVKNLVETIMSSANDSTRKVHSRKKSDSVSIASILKMSNKWEDDALDLASEQGHCSLNEWSRIEGKAEGLRQCARDIRRMLEKGGDWKVEELDRDLSADDKGDD